MSGLVTGDGDRTGRRRAEIQRRAGVVRRAAQTLADRNDPRADTWAHAADLMAETDAEDTFPGIYAEAVNL